MKTLPNFAQGTVPVSVKTVPVPVTSVFLPNSTIEVIDESIAVDIQSAIKVSRSAIDCKQTPTTTIASRNITQKVQQLELARVTITNMAAERAAKSKRKRETMDSEIDMKQVEHTLKIRQLDLDFENSCEFHRIQLANLQEVQGAKLGNLQAEKDMILKEHTMKIRKLDLDLENSHELHRVQLKNSQQVKGDKLEHSQEYYRSKMDLNRVKFVYYQERQHVKLELLYKEHEVIMKIKEIKSAIEHKEL